MPRTGSLKGFTESASFTPSTTTYTKGDIVGGKLTFHDIIDQDFGSVRLISAQLIDTSTVTPVPYKLMLWGKDMTGSGTGTGTVWTDNSAFDAYDSDLATVGAVISFATGNVLQLADNQMWNTADINQSIDVTSSDRAIYGALIAASTGGGAFTSGGTVTVNLNFERIE
jgi:hypothetical protein